MISAVTILLIWLMVFPAFAAEVNFAYPKAPTKKGLYITPGMEEDALELGVRHTTINLSVSDFLPTPANRNSSYAYAFSYGGTTYYFAKHAIAQYDRELTRLAQNGVLVTAILLLPARSDLTELIYLLSSTRFMWERIRIFYGLLISLEISLILVLHMKMMLLHTLYLMVGNTT